jgi:hypothetical protein
MTKASKAEMTGGIIGDLITMGGGRIEIARVQDEDRRRTHQDF